MRSESGLAKAVAVGASLGRRPRFCDALNVRTVPANRSPAAQRVLHRPLGALPRPRGEDGREDERHGRAARDSSEDVFGTLREELAVLHLLRLRIHAVLVVVVCLLVLVLVLAHRVVGQLEPTKRVTRGASDGGERREALTRRERRAQRVEGGDAKAVRASAAQVGQHVVWRARDDRLGQLGGGAALALPQDGKVGREAAARAQRCVSPSDGCRVRAGGDGHVDRSAGSELRPALRVDRGDPDGEHALLSSARRAGAARALLASSVFPARS